MSMLRVTSKLLTLLICVTSVTAMDILMDPEWGRRTQLQGMRFVPPNRVEAFFRRDTLRLTWEEDQVVLPRFLPDGSGFLTVEFDKTERATAFVYRAQGLVAELDLGHGGTVFYLPELKRYLVCAAVRPPDLPGSKTLFDFSLICFDSTFKHLFSVPSWRDWAEETWHEDWWSNYSPFSSASAAKLRIIQPLAYSGARELTALNGTTIEANVVTGPLLYEPKTGRIAAGFAGRNVLWSPTGVVEGKWKIDGAIRTGMSDLYARMQEPIYASAYSYEAPADGPFFKLTRPVPAELPTTGVLAFSVAGECDLFVDDEKIAHVAAEEQYFHTVDPGSYIPSAFSVTGWEWQGQERTVSAGDTVWVNVEFPE